MTPADTLLALGSGCIGGCLGLAGGIAWGWKWWADERRLRAFADRVAATARIQRARAMETLQEWRIAIRGYEHDIARVSADLCDRTHLHDRLQRQLDAVLSENHRLRVANNAGAKLAAYKRKGDAPGRYERDTLVRSMRRDRAA